MTSRRWPLLVVLAAAAALGQTPQHRLFLQPNLPHGASYAYLEFAPASGAGMGTACACSTVTGAKGETVMFARTGAATCTKTATGGLATSGIADGDLVSCASDQPRVEYDSAGVLGLLIEASRQNVLLRSDAPANAAWSDVGAPGLTTGQTDPFGATNGVTFDDDDGAAYEGRSQTVTVTATTAYTMSCYLKAGTSTKARLSLDGTGCNVSGLSTTTWTVGTCADASSSGVSISAQVLVGNATTDTGSIIVGGCQVEVGTYATSYIPTTAAAVTRQADTASLPAQTYLATAGSVAASITIASIAPCSAGCPILDPSATSRYLYLYAGYLRTYDSLNIAGPLYTGLAARSAFRGAASWSGSSQTAFNTTGGTSASSTFDGSHAVTSFQLGYSSWGTPIDGIISRVCADPAPTRCR